MAAFDDKALRLVVAGRYQSALQHVADLEATPDRGTGYAATTGVLLEDG